MNYGLENIDKSVLNLKTGGLFRVRGSFYLQNGRIGCGTVNFNGGTLVSGAGTLPTEGEARMNAWVREGGMVVSNNNSLNIKLSLRSGAENDGGVTNGEPAR